MRGIVFNFRPKSTAGAYLPIYPTFRKHFPLYLPSSSDQRRLVFLISFCRRNSLEKVEIGFGVGEFFNFFDLQVSAFVSNDVSDEDHFAIHVHPDRGLGKASELRDYNSVSPPEVGWNT